MLTGARRDRLAYRLAGAYILSLGVPGVTAELLAEYQRPAGTRVGPRDLAGVYRGLLESAQNKAMAPAVIGRAIGGIENLAKVTFGFSPARVCERYADGGELLREIKRSLRPRGKIRTAQGSLWPQFCKSAVTGARFLAGFDSADQFYRWVDSFHDDDRKLPGLPLLLSKEIYGIGFALACDFLKELGFTKFAKPDVHVRTIMRGLGLCEPKGDDYAVFKAVLRVARSQDTTAYDVDKTFWLVGSGRFYNHRHIGKNGRVRTDRSGFIRSARKELDQRAGR